MNVDASTAISVQFWSRDVNRPWESIKRCHSQRQDAEDCRLPSPWRRRRLCDPMFSHSVELRLVTDGRTDRQTHSIFRASVASRSIKASNALRRRVGLEVSGKRNVFRVSDGTWRAGTTVLEIDKTVWSFLFCVCLNVDVVVDCCQEFVMGLSLLLRGTLLEKLEWTFNLYDINRDGIITADEMYMIVSSVYDIIGNFTEPRVDENSIRDHVDSVFNVRRIHGVP